MTCNDSRQELLNLFPDNSDNLIEARDIRAFVNSIYDEAVIKSCDVIDNLNTVSIELPLSANQGRILNETKEDKFGDPSGLGYVLSSDSSGNRFWIPQIRSIHKLDDVTENIPQHNDVLVYDEIKSIWELQNLDTVIYAEQGGVLWRNDIGYKRGDVVTYNSELYFALAPTSPGSDPENSNVWRKVPRTIVLNDLEDVDTGVLKDFDYLSYNATTSTWKARSFTEDVKGITHNALFGGIGIDVFYDYSIQKTKIQLNAYINDLQDVDTLSTQPKIGDTLLWDGSNWKPSNIIDTVDKGGTEWKAGRWYQAGDLCTQNGVTYTALFANYDKPPVSSNAWRATTLGTLPDVDAEFPNPDEMLIWDIVLQKWKTIHTTTVGGSVNSYKIPRLNDLGQLDPSMIEIAMFYRVGSHDPVIEEYPDTDGENRGAFWDIRFTDGTTLEYTYTTGDLAGTTVKTGDFIIWSGGTSWSVMPAIMNPLEYYRRDGLQPITDNFQANNFRLVNVANGVDLKDAVNMEQLSLKEDNLGNPAQNGYILSSDVQGNRSWIENTGGLQEVFWDTIEPGDPYSNQDLADALNEKANVIDVFDKTEYLTISDGNANRPIVTTTNGKIDSSFIDIQGLTFVANWTPSSGNEYPAGANANEFWIIDGLTLPYTFLTGSLAGQTTTNGDWMIYNGSTWSLVEFNLDPNAYYRLDGTKGLEAHFAGGGYQIKNIAQGTDFDDAITLQQHNLHTNDTNNPHNVTKAQIGLDQVENIAPSDMPISDDVQSALDDKEDYLNIPAVSGQVLSSDTNGNRSWISLSDEAQWGLITGDINQQTDLQNQFNTKVNKSGDTVTGQLNIENTLKADLVLLNSINNQAFIEFHNTNVGNNTGIFWDSQSTLFKVLDNNGDVWNLLHEGVIDPSKYIQTTGGTMTGKLKLDYNPSLPDDAVHVEYVQNALSSFPAPIDIMQKTVYDTNNSGIVDDAEKLGGFEPSYYATQDDLNTKVSKSGDTMTGDLNVPNLFTNYVLTQDLEIKYNPVTEQSRIEFQPIDYPSQNPAIFWDKVTQNFKIDEIQTRDHIIWHSGNFNPNNINPMVRRTFIGDGVTDTFNIPEEFTPYNVNVYYNGVRLIEGTDYDSSNGKDIVFTVAPEVDDNIHIEAFKSPLLGDNISP